MEEGSYLNGQNQNALYCTALQYTTLHYTALHCTTRHCTTLYYTILHYIALYFLQYTALQKHSTRHDAAEWGMQHRSISYLDIVLSGGQSWPPDYSRLDPADQTQTTDYRLQNCCSTAAVVQQLQTTAALASLYIYIYSYIGGQSWIFYEMPLVS